MEVHAENWAMLVIAQLVHQARRVREKAHGVLELAMPVLRRHFSGAAAAASLSALVPKVLLPQMSQIYKDNADCRCYVVELWCVAMPKKLP